QYSTFRMKNKAVSMAWDWQQFSFSYMNRFGSWPRERETIGRTLKQDIYHEVKEWNKGYNSLFCDASIKDALDDFKSNKKKILNGEVSIICYKRNGAFPIRASQIKHLNKINLKQYSSKLSILTPARAKELGFQTQLKHLNTIHTIQYCSQQSIRTPARSTELGFPTQLKVILEAGNGGNDIIDRIMNGTYQLAYSKIEYKKQKNEFFLLMNYKFEK